MPGNTPLTDSPYPLLADAPNIEAAVKPAVENLETFTIPRFPSISARNSAFLLAPAPEEGQLIFVSGVGYQAWDGTEWSSFAKVSNEPIVQCAVRSATVTKSAPYVDEQLRVNAEANKVYIVDVFGVPNAASDRVMEVGFFAPSGSVITYGVLGAHGASDKTNTYLEAKSRLEVSLGPSATIEIPVAAREGTSGQDWDGFRLTATVFVGGQDGFIALAWEPQAGPVDLCKGSWIKAVTVPDA